MECVSRIEMEEQCTLALAPYSLWCHSGVGYVAGLHLQQANQARLGCCRVCWQCLR